MLKNSCKYTKKQKFLTKITKFLRKTTNFLQKQQNFLLKNKKQKKFTDFAPETVENRRSTAL